MSQASRAEVRAELPGPERIDHAGLLAGTRVLTAEGVLPVELLGPGDRVITRAGMRRLLAVEWLVQARAPVVRIAPRSLGAGRPGVVVVVGPAQPLLIRDWRAQALWGQAEAVVPARRLVDGSLIRDAVLPVAHFLTLHFAADEVVYAEGVEIACASQRVTA